MKTHLFITGLAEEINEGGIVRHFEHIDRTIQIRTINILRPHGVIKARGAAIIDFATYEDAQKALSAANYTELGGKEIQLMWYQAGGLRDRVTGNVFVKNLPPDFKSKELFELFSSTERVLSSRVRYNINGTCKGYGYVQFEDKESTDKAISEFNNKEIRGYKISVEPFKARDKRDSSINMYNNLFVKCIPKRYTNEELKNLFATCGNIISAVVIKERADDVENKGFGFVCFERAEDARAAEEKLKTVQIEGQALYVTRALPMEEHRKKMREERFKMFKDCNVYVKNLPEEIDDEKLKQGFAPFGYVISARVMMESRQDPTTGNKELKSKGFGFVCFSNSEEARKAISGVETQQIFGRTLVAAIAEKREDRAARFAQVIYQMPMGVYPPVYRNPRPRRTHVLLF